MTADLRAFNRQVDGKWGSIQWEEPDMSGRDWVQREHVGTGGMLRPEKVDKAHENYADTGDDSP
eukprot:CAMPEP_0174384548 /NCGR_PEP_ID=MMETSP0811_2-20130205/125995_1 /TAXON_ID=73025 ORGANISM="Eutreptiella gymnastica-like, Strain CCMP1594" /NCGR_SAMPLE_ID=MMETSP0811_2 /ASSEMBLY_ACC=CAM_ASM_000667 /LENGTH=63 /DNA_ID=CAMNT_0015538547 /DNA_START=95 /DNA_END=286 /DNA_ORIENTATION=+